MKLGVISIPSCVPGTGGGLVSGFTMPCTASISNHPPPNAALEHAGCFFKGPSEAGEAETRHVHLKHVQAKCRTGHPKPTTVGPGTRITSLCLLAPSYQHDQHWACTSSNCLFSYRTA